MHVSINWHCPHQDARNIKDEIILTLFKSNHLEAYKIEYGRLSGYENVIREDHQNCLFDKKGTFYNKLSTRKKRWETFLAKRVMIKVFHQPWARGQFVYLFERLASWSHFQRKGNLIKNYLKLRLKFAWKVCRKHAAWNYEIWIIRKHMVTERVEVNSLRSEHYYQKQNLEMTPYLFSKFQIRKRETL